MARKRVTGKTVEKLLLKRGIPDENKPEARARLRRFLGLDSTTKPKRGPKSLLAKPSGNPPLKQGMIKIISNYKKRLK